MKKLIIILLIFIIFILFNIFFNPYLNSENLFRGLKDKIREKSGIEEKIVKDLLKTEEFLPVITYPLPDSTVSIPVTIKGTVSKEIDYIELKLNDGAWQKISKIPNWSITFNTISTGYHIIYIHAVEKDIRGPDISMSFYSYYLPEKPVIIFPTGGMWVKMPLTNKGTALGNIDVVEVKLDNGVWNTANGTLDWYYTFNSISTGEHTLYSRVKNRLGTGEEASVNFKVYDNPPPKPVITFPISSSYVGLPLTNRGTASGKIDLVEIKLDTGIWESASGITNWFYIFNSISTGNHALYIRTKNEFGYSLESSVNFYIYGIPPAPFIISPNEGEYYNYPITNIGTAIGKIDLIEVKLDTNEWKTATGNTNWFYIFNFIFPGNHTLYARAVNEIGVGPESSVNFNVFTKFQKTSGKAEKNGGRSVMQTSDGGYIITGSIWPSDPQNYDVWIIKTDYLGNTNWTKTFGGSWSDVGYNVKQTLDGGYIIVGSKGSASGYDIYLIKIDSSGSENWTKIYNRSSSDYGYEVQQTSDNGYIIGGYTKSSGTLNYDVYLIKTDSTGATQWTRTYGSTNDDKGYCVQQTLDNGYIIAGSTKPFGLNHDVYLIKTDSTGATQWTRTYGDHGGNLDTGRYVQQTSDGGYIITGYTTSFGAGSGDVYLIKTDSMGNTNWTKTFGGTNDDRSLEVKQTTDEGYIIIGDTKSFGYGEQDVYLIKTDNNGNELWSNTFGGTNNDDGRGVFQCNDEGYIIIGSTSSFGNGVCDMYLIKTDHSGNSD